MNSGHPIAYSYTDPEVAVGAKHGSFTRRETEIFRLGLAHAAVQAETGETYPPVEQVADKFLGETGSADRDHAADQTLHGEDSSAADLIQTHLDSMG